MTNEHNKKSVNINYLYYKRLHVTMATTCVSLTSSCSATLIELQAITQQTPICQSTNLTMVTTVCLIKTQLSISSGHHRNQLNLRGLNTSTHTAKSGSVLELSQFTSPFCATGEQTCVWHVGQEVLTLTKLEGNQASLSAPLPHHQSVCEASRTRITSPALKASSCSSMVTWSQRASAFTAWPELIHWVAHKHR